MYNLPDTSFVLENNSYIKGTKKKSKKIPFWLWSIIAKFYGIQTHPNNDKQIVATILRILTITSAAGLIVTNIWFFSQDILSNNTKTDIIDGLIRLSVLFMFCGIGIYAHWLGYRVFSHSKFLSNMRLHSKTIMKMNTAYLLLLLQFLFFIVQNISLVSYLHPYYHEIKSEYSNGTTNNPSSSPCQKTSIPIPVCHVFFWSHFVFSFFFLLWNIGVSSILVSLARSHTYAVRKFILELELDALLQEEVLSKQCGYRGEERRREETQDFSRCQLALSEETSVSVKPLTFDLDNELEDEDSLQPHILSNEEIMYKYWKLSTQVRFTSVAFQRWMIWIVTTILFWSCIHIVHWLNHVPSVYEVLRFIFPLLFLPLIASSYAEVNYDGIKVIHSIIPTGQRTEMFRYLRSLPIEMTTYGHPITYATLGTVFMGISAAFISKIVLQEINDILK